MFICFIFVFLSFLLSFTFPDLHTLLLPYLYSPFYHHLFKVSVTTFYTTQLQKTIVFVIDYFTRVVFSNSFPNFIFFTISTPKQITDIAIGITYPTTAPVSP